MQKKAIENAIKRTRETQAVRENTNSKNSENAKLKKNIYYIDCFKNRHNKSASKRGAYSATFYIGWSSQPM